MLKLDQVTVGESAATEGNFSQKNVKNHTLIYTDIRVKQLRINVIDGLGTGWVDVYSTQC